MTFARPSFARTLWTHFPLAAVLSLAASTGFALGNSEGTGPKMQNQDPCLAEVSKFEQAIGFIRQTTGNKAAAELKEKLLPSKVENDILLKDGYCGLAKYLKDKKLL